MAPRRRSHSMTGKATAILACFAAIASGFGAAGSMPSPPVRYATAAPMADYRMTNADEITMARSAAPPAVSDNAEILVLGQSGYVTAAKGGNGFVCLVERSWANELDHPEFWNPKVRGPLCMNPAAVRSVLPAYVQRTKWVLAGASKAQIVRRTMLAIAAERIGPPAAGAMSFMMSKLGNLGDSAGGGPWHSHIMLFVPRETTYPADWGADLPGSPIMATGKGASIDPAALYFIPVAKWSDGTSAEKGM